MCSRFLLALSSLAFCISPVLAQPQPRLTVLTPPGGQAGTAVKVALAGTDLEDTTSLLIAPAGLGEKRIALPRLPILSRMVQRLDLPPAFRLHVFPYPDQLFHNTKTGAAHDLTRVIDQFCDVGSQSWL